jgi:hypothetical protein
MKTPQLTKAERSRINPKPLHVEIRIISVADVARDNTIYIVNGKVVGRFSEFPNEADSISRCGNPSFSP